MEADLAIANWQINFAIAQIMGWKVLEQPVVIDYFWRPGSSTKALATVSRPDGTPALESWVPRYCEDLNAMSEAEKTLNIDQQYLYGDALAQEVRREENVLAGDDPESEFPLNGWGHYSVATIGASTRARVFLKLFGPKGSP